MKLQHFVFLICTIGISPIRNEAQEAKHLDSTYALMTQTPIEQRVKPATSYLEHNGELYSKLDSNAILEVIDWCRNDGDSLNHLHGQYLEAQYSKIVSNNPRALHLGNIILASTKSTEQMRESTKRFMRNLYFKLGAFDKAISLHSSINWDELARDKESIAPESFLAFLYIQIEEFEAARRLLKSSIKKMRNNQLSYCEMSYTNSLGVVYQRLGLRDSAMSAYAMAEKILLETYKPKSANDSAKFHFIKGLISGNKGEVLESRGEYLQAIPFYKQDVFSSLRRPLIEEHIENGINSQLHLGYCFIEIGRFSEARKSLNEAHHLLQEYDHPKLYQTYLRHQIKFYESIQELDSAYHLTKGFLAIWDLHIKNQNKVKAQNLQIASASMLEEQRLKQAAEQVMVLKAEKEKRNYLIILIGGIVVIASLIILLVYNFYRKLLGEEKKLSKASQELKEKQAQLKTTLEEKETLLKEVHHRVKNNLQIISSLFFLQAKKTDDPIAKEALQQGQARVQSMAVIHQRLYDSESFNTIDFRKYMRDLCDQIISSNQLGEKDIRLDIEVADIGLTVDKAVPLSLMLHELITNSLKHAFSGDKAGTISIRIKTETDKIILEYSDSGKGFTEEQMNHENAGIGLKLIGLLASQLKGETQTSRNNRAFILSFPILQE